MVNAKLRMYVQEGTPARGYLKTALSIFPLYSDIKRLSTLCGHRMAGDYSIADVFFSAPTTCSKSQISICLRSK